jgi:uncharacterized protein (TIGR02172 family)
MRFSDVEYVRQTLRAQKQGVIMVTQSIEQYHLIAEGGQSKIYDYDVNKILRVPKREMDYDRIKYEYQVYKFLEDKISVPHVYEIIDIDNKPSLIMEKIKGIDLYSTIKKNPLIILSIPNILAKLHSSLFTLSISDKFRTNHQKAQYCIEHADIISNTLKQKLFTILKQLPDGSTLCHGDFHPGNIIKTIKKDYIIDWSSASIGSSLFDIAHTYLLLINTPRLDNVSDKEFFIQKKVTGYIGKKYLKKVCKQNNINVDSLFPYLLIKAGERCFYGMNSEKEWLSSFIDKNIDKKSIKVFKIRNFA